jgi:type IV pilus assembly protein PilX
MLAMNRSPLARAMVRRTQDGLTLIIVLIVLVAMTLAGISMMNSVNTAGLVAGNLAFRQAAVHAGDIGTETAITWLQTNAGPKLYVDIPTSGYFAQKADPSAASQQTWDDFWNTLDPSPVTRPVKSAQRSGSVMTLATDDATGTTVSYIIHRLCNGPGSPTAVGVDCAIAPSSMATSGNSNTAGSVPLKYSSQSYYRITSRIEGPRNTVSYVQTVIAL